MAAPPLEHLFSDLFRDLAIAWRALSAYPAGHPAAVQGLAKASASLGRLLAATGPLELAATRDALHWQDRRYVSPTALQLAKLLRRRRAAGCTFEPGVSASEIETFLTALALDNRAVQSAGSLAEELAAAGLTRLRVHDLDFSAIALVETDEEATLPIAGALANRLVKRLLAAGALPPAALAAWITSGRSAGELLQLLLDSEGAAPELADWGGAAFAVALRAAADDFGESPDGERAAGVAALHARLTMGGRERLLGELTKVVSTAGAAQTLVELDAALPAPVAAELRRAVGEASGDGGSEPPEATPATASKRQLSAQQLALLRRAFEREDVDATPADEEAAAGLEALLELPERPRGLILKPAALELARELSGRLDRGSATAWLELAGRSEVEVGLLSPILQRFDAAFRRLLTSGRLRQAMALAERVQKQAGSEGERPLAFRRAAERISGREALEHLVAAMPEMPEDAIALLPDLLQRLGPTAVRHLLGVLAETDNRRLRHLLLDLLARLGPAVVRDATALLADTRWYVVRNMLLLLRRVGDPGSVPAVRRCADHPDLRVRLEAIRNLFAFDPEVPRELLRRTLLHPDPRQAEAAMELAGEHGIAEAVAPMVAYLQTRDLFGRRRSVRLKAIRALAAIGDPAALGGLKAFRSRFQLFPPALEERRELYRTLSQYPEAELGEWVESGLAARDGEIRRSAEALARAARRGG